MEVPGIGIAVVGNGVVDQENRQRGGRSAAERHHLTQVLNEGRDAARLLPGNRHNLALMGVPYGHLADLVSDHIEEVSQSNGTLRYFSLFMSVCFIQDR